MDLVTYAAINGITKKEAEEVLTTAGPAKEEPKRKVKPSDYFYKDPCRGNHYAGRGAARSWRRIG